jgi:hypothetical protein
VTDLGYQEARLLRIENERLAARVAALEAVHEAAKAVDEEAAETGGVVSDRTRARLWNALVDAKAVAAANTEACNE